MSYLFPRIFSLSNTLRICRRCQFVWLSICFAKKQDWWHPQNVARNSWGSLYKIAICPFVITETVYTLYFSVFFIHVFLDSPHLSVALFEIDDLNKNTTSAATSTRFYSLERNWKIRHIDNSLHLCLPSWQMLSNGKSSMAQGLTYLLKWPELS